MRRRHGLAGSLAFIVVVAAVIIGNDECPDPWPGWSAFCPSQVADEIDSNSGETWGTDFIPTPPTLPSGSVTNYSGAAVDTAAEVETAMQGAGHSVITLPNDIAGIGVHQGGTGAQDVTIYLNGHTIDSVVFGYGTGDAARIVFIGGHIKSVLGFNSSGALDDVIFHGVFFQQTANAQVIQINGETTARRWSFTNCIVGGLPAGGTSCGGFLIGGGDDIVIANTNIEGCTSSGTPDDVWGIRSAGDRVWAVDTFIAAHFKQVFRHAHGSTVVYTTDACVDQACQSTLVHEEFGGMHVTVGDPSIAAAFLGTIRARWFVGDSLSGGGAIFGPEATTDFSYIAGNTICSKSAAFFDSGDLAARDNGTTWLTDNLTYDGEATTFTHADPVSGCPIPAWPTRNAEAIPGIANSAITGVGADPRGTPP